MALPASRGRRVSYFSSANHLADTHRGMGRLALNDAGTAFAAVFIQLPAHVGTRFNLSPG
jgi:hypothetical protein